MNIIYNFAKQFIELGISVMPLYHRSKEPMLPAWGHLQTQQPDTEYLVQWFATDWCNYAVICGWCNLVVIDFDNMFYFDIWREWCGMSSDTQYLSQAFQVRTRQGMHVYVCTETPACNDKRISIKGGIDVQAQGKYVVGPLSTHPSGHVYAPIGELVFPVVANIETILPLDLFPRVAHEQTVFNGVAPEFATTNTEYQTFDAYQAAMFPSAMDLIAKVKSRVRIETLFAGVQRSSADGRWLKALCPFHADAHQSAWIDVQRQLAGCQVCGMKPMDAINLYARMHNVNESVAVSQLAEECGVWR